MRRDKGLGLKRAAELNKRTGVIQSVKEVSKDTQIFRTVLLIVFCYCYCNYC